jgi:hypothetical protein
VLGALVVGSAIGTAQWLVLRTKIPLSNRYVLATSLGWFVAGFIQNYIFFGSNRYVLATSLGWFGAGFFQNYNFFGATGGFLVGLAQWTILRRFFFQAGWWVLVNTLGWGLAGFLSFQASSRLDPYAASLGVLVNPGVLVFGGCTGIIAAFTGFLLVWLLIYKKREPEVRD